MARLSDTLVGEGQGFHNQSATPMVNVAGVSAGQQGLLTDLRGYINNAAYVRRNVICVVMQTPRGFNDLPESALWHSTFKALMENGAKTITGLNSTLNVEFVSNPIGASGEQQEDISRVTRERSVPVFTFGEKYGKAINRAFDGYIRYLIGDADSQVPAVTAISDSPTDLLPDYTSFTCMFFEPDPLHKTVVEAWLVTNMMPNTAGEVTGQRDLTAGGESLDYSIQWTGIQQVGAGVKQLAQELLNGMNLTGVNPNRRQAFLTAIGADVSSATQGYSEVIKAAAENSI